MASSAVNPRSIFESARRVILGAFFIVTVSHFHLSAFWAVALGWAGGGLAYGVLFPMIEDKK